MSFGIQQGQTGIIDPNLDLIDSGWTISGAIATHVACNAGTMMLNMPFGLEVGKTYIITYDVINYISGTVKVLCGTTSGTVISAGGPVTDTLVCAGDPHIYFYSDGNLSLDKVAFYLQPVEGYDNSITISFNEKDKRWGADFSFKPDLYVKFIDQLITFKNGGMWVHNQNPVRNNFYGVQYNSVITFIVNDNPTTVKVFFSMRVESNRAWGAIKQGDISIFPTEGQQLGMQSRLKAGNFRRLQGSYFGNFLRNMLDPTQPDIETALFRGEVLRGRVMEVTITNTDTIEVFLFEVDVKTASSLYTY